MPAYDSSAFHPPAPLALVTIRSPLSGVAVANVPMLLDSGADVSLLPRESIAELIAGDQGSQRFELEGFNGAKSWAPVVHLELQFLGKSFRGQFLVVDASYGYLGRNILNNVALLLDGPSLSWNVSR